MAITPKSGATDVYDLTVDDAHEFYAGGILVHNCLWVPESLESPDRLDACVWAISELKGLGVADWSTAYGTHRCGKCDRMFLLRDRKACPHCSFPIGEDNGQEATGS